jgi:hypothetical protein
MSVALRPGSGRELRVRAREVAGGRSLRRPTAPQVTFGELLVRSLDDFTLRVLLGAGALSLALQAALGGDGEAGGWVEGAAILAAVAVVALVTAANDFQKEQQFRALSELSSAADVRAPYPTLRNRTTPPGGPGGGVCDGQRAACERWRRPGRARAQVTVLRDGRTQEIDTGQLVVGDVMLFATGNILAADGILFQGDEIRRAPPRPRQACPHAATCALTRPELKRTNKLRCQQVQQVPESGSQAAFSLPGTVTGGRQCGVGCPAPHVPQRSTAGHAGCLRAQRRWGRALRRVAGGRLTPARPRRRRADESHLTGESGDVLKAPGGAALMLSGAKACPPPRPEAGAVCRPSYPWVFLYLDPSMYRHM